MKWGSLLFFSGAAALVYQTLWVKQLSLVVGVDVYAVATGVAAFFAGLALGSYFFGKRADLSERPVMIFAGLEVGIAAVGILATIVLSNVAAAFVSLQASVGPVAWALPFLVVGIPAFLMGGTLPAVLRASEPEEGTVGRSSGRLYAANTAGAIVGALATVLVLIPSFGVRGSGLVAGALNLAVGLAAVAISRRVPVRQLHRMPRPEEMTLDARRAVMLYALAGGIALGYEVVWSQAIIQFLSTRTFAFAVVLATYLLGLVIGASVYARFADRVERPWAVFGGLIAGAGASALLLFAIVGAWLTDLQSAVGGLAFDLTGNHLAKMSARFAVAAFVLILPTTVLLGAAFPAAVRIIATAKHVGRDVGAVAAWNTAGGIAGTFLTGFVLVPALGLMRSLSVLAVGATLVGGFALQRGPGDKGRARVIAGVVVVAVLAIAVVLPRDKLGTLLADARGGRLVFYEESAEGVVAVLEQQSVSDTFRRLYIQGVSNTGDAMPSRRYMRLQALLPLLVHPGEPRSALVIGLGTGITSGALTAYPLESRTCAELVPAVVRAAPEFAGNFWRPGDPRIQVELRDGRHHLLATAKLYDLITMEPPPPSAAGVVNLYSVEFYRLARARLAPGGLFAQWWPIATQNHEDSQALMKSVLEVFPHVTVWTTEFHEMMVIGSGQPLVIDADKVSERFDLPDVQAALSEVGVSSTAELLATFVMTETGLSSYVGDASPVTDDRPRIEYAPWVRPDEITRVLPRLMRLAETPPVTGSGQLLRDRVLEERRELFDFYDAALAKLDGDLETAVRLVRRVLARDGENPYYRWVIGRVPD